MGTADLTDVSKARDAVEDAARSARRQLESARHELADRAGSARGVLLERIDEVDLEPQVRRAKIGFWTAMRTLIGALAALPGLLTRGLGSLSHVADDAVEASAELSERSRKLVRSVPLTKAARRRARARTAAWTVGGFALGAAVGMAVGYLLGRREPDLAEDLWETTQVSSQQARDAATGAVDRMRSGAAATVTSAGDAIQDTADDVTTAVDTAADDAAAAMDAAADELAPDDGEAADRGAGR